MIWLIIVASSVVLFCGIFALIEAAIAYVDEIKLKRLLRKNVKNKKHIEDIITKKRHYISAIITINTLISITGSAYIGIESTVVFGIGTYHALAFTVALAYFVLVFSKILPKIAAINNYEAILIHTAIFTKVIKVLLTPIFVLTYPWTWLVKTDKNDLTINDLKSVIDYYSEKGVLIEQQSLLLDRVFSIKEKRVEELLTTYKDELIVLNIKTVVADCRDMIAARKAKRYIVSDIEDNVVGIAFQRDLSNQLINKNKELTIENCMYEAIVIHEEDNVLESLAKFKRKKNAYAIVNNDKEEPVAIISEKQLYSYAMR
jgi:CBS domain containing-hemolysin-like protein